MIDIVRFVGQNNCSEPTYIDKLEDSSNAIVDTFSALRNVTIQFYRDGKRVEVPMSPIVRDFTHLAVCVYIADELVKRTGNPDGWCRDFHLTIPVKDQVAWIALEPNLRRALHFLSQDRFRFSFPLRTSVPKGIKHRAALPKDYDAVCLFSGGIDSLLGAYTLLREGKKLLLVGHQAEPVTSFVQKELARQLRARFPNQVCLVQCRVARSKNALPKFVLPAKVEESHRPRSFLFLSLAIAVASAARIKSIYMPENGLIALNPPLQVSRVGSHSTRTAHPTFLSLFLQTVSPAIFDGEIKNPFLYMSKTDMLDNLDPWLVPLIRRSISCSHPSRFHDEGVHHCGYCVPCLYRRAAMMPYGMDSGNDYAFDVWRDRKSLVKKRPLTIYAQSDVRAMVVFAQKIANETDAELTLRILAHGYFEPSIGRLIGPSAVSDYGVWTSMLRRWANCFLAEVPLRCTRLRAKSLGLLLRGDR